jgi:putative OPT family oligopeptide transporter
LALGAVLAVVFGAGNAFLGLKVGMTVSASIPAAVVSMAVLRAFFKRVSILENNIVQTTASAGQSLASGVIFTIPALIFLGEPPTPLRIFILSVLGGTLGVVFMIPLRRYLVVQEHGRLPFPEGTACAEILKAGEQGGARAGVVVWGALWGAACKLLSGALRLWPEAPHWPLRWLQRTELGLEATPALLGVGYIIGPRIAAVMLAGGAMGWLVLIPLFRLFGAGAALPIYPSELPIADMSASAIWSRYVRYVGAGAVAAGGLIGLVRAGPVILKSVRVGVLEVLRGLKHREAKSRTDDDLPMGLLTLGAGAIALALWLLPGMPLNLLAVGLVLALGFFFVAVSSMTAGLVGTSSNPTSGMTLATLLVTSLLFAALGWTDGGYMIAAMTVGATVCIAICIAGDTSQDLKTGYLLGATPRLQQLAELVGLVVPAVFMGGVLYLLHKAYVLGSPQLAAPQATLMSMVVKGVMTGSLPWDLVAVGAVLGGMVELMGIHALPFAVGLYLPLSLSTPIMAGGLVSAAVSRLAKDPAEAQGRGVLAASGLVAGDALTGVVIALLAVLQWVSVGGEARFGPGAALAAFACVAGALYSLALGRKG